MRRRRGGRRAFPFPRHRPELVGPSFEAAQTKRERPVVLRAPHLPDERQKMVPAPFQVLRCVDANVKIFLHEDGHTSHSQAKKDPHQQVEQEIGRNGGGRHDRPVDDVDISEIRLLSDRGVIVALLHDQVQFFRAQPRALEFR